VLWLNNIGTSESILKTAEATIPNITITPPPNTSKETVDIEVLLWK